jgi:hypothetical protein
MKAIIKTIRVILIGLTLFLSLTGILGGAALMANFYAPPLDYLAGSIFKSFVLPGLALSVVVGGSALLAAILLLRKSSYGVLAAAAAGTIIMFFEFVEVMVIGSPAGPARIMQVFFFGLGTGIVALSMGTWFLALRSNVDGGKL